MYELTAQFEILLAASFTNSFDGLIERHKALVFRTAWRMLGSTADAEDITQEVFLRLYKTLHGLPKGLPPSVWLYRVTVNLCLDQIRKRKPIDDMPLATLAAQKSLS